jgi:hypothetical protein
VIAGGECRKRERRKTGAPLQCDAQPRFSADMVGMRLSALRSLYLQEASLFLEMASWS